MGLGRRDVGGVRTPLTGAQTTEKGRNCPHGPFFPSTPTPAHSAPLNISLLAWGSEGQTSPLWATFQGPVTGTSWWGAGDPSRWHSMPLSEGLVGYRAGLGFG